MIREIRFSVRPDFRTYQFLFRSDGENYEIMKFAPNNGPTIWKDGTPIKNPNAMYRQIRYGVFEDIDRHISEFKKEFRRNYFD